MPHAERALRALIPSGVRLLAQRGEGLGERLTHLFGDLLSEHAAALAVDTDSPTLPMAWVADGLAALAERSADVTVSRTAPRTAAFSRR
jgi:Uncharacterized protein conserved in bacteria (DUF2064)